MTLKQVERMIEEFEANNGYKPFALVVPVNQRHILKSQVHGQATMDVPMDLESGKEGVDILKVSGVYVVSRESITQPIFESKEEFSKYVEGELIDDDNKSD